MDLASIDKNFAVPYPELSSYIHVSNVEIFSKRLIDVEEST